MGRVSLARDPSAPNNNKRHRSSIDRDRSKRNNRGCNVIRINSWGRRRNRSRRHGHGERFGTRFGARVANRFGGRREGDGCSGNSLRVESGDGK